MNDIKLDDDTKRKLYLSLCDEMDELINRYNPCKFYEGKCFRGVLCCEGCKYVTDKGCSVKSLLCKLWLCDEAMRIVPKDFIISAEGIFSRANRHTLLLFRGSEEDVMEGNVVKQRVVIKMPWNIEYNVDSAQELEEVII